MSWTLRDDLAEAAVAALTDTSLLQGITAPLTALRTNTFAGIAQMASGILGSEVAFEVVSAESYRQAALQRGFPESVGMLLSMFEAMEDGEFNVVDSTLEKVLAREPKQYASALAGFLAQSGTLQSH